MAPSNDNASSLGNINAKPSTNLPKRTSNTLLPFLHDKEVPFNDSSQGVLDANREREQNTKAYLDKWDKDWKTMKKE